MLEQRQYQFITSEVQEDVIGVVTMTRPEKRNALSLELMRELITAFEAIGARHDLRVVILRGEGAAFSAGHDLKELQCRDAGAYNEIFDTCVQLMEVIQRVPQPVIAQVATLATAAGCQLVAACDLAVASQDAKFATPGVRIGLFCTTPMVALTRAVGRKRAMEMLLTGDFIDAPTALAWGLVNRVAPPDQLHEHTLELARKVAQAAAPVVALGKQAFYVQMDLAQSAAYGYAKTVMSMNALGQEAQEGIAAFLERRPPRWH
jgi:enoyl-CoA hydratase/carnithine racemase